MKNHRIIIVVFFVAFLWGLLLLRGAYLQLIPNPQLEAVKKRQFQKIIRLSSKRGDIFDRNGQELAASVIRYSLYADPKIIKKPYIAAKKMARELNVPFKPLYRKIKNKKKRFVWIKRRMDRKQYEKIKDWGIRGLAFKEEYKRVYPHKGMAKHLMGFIGREAQGLDGLEKQYEKHLTANQQKLQLQRDARGRALVEDGWVFSQNPDGSDVHLTLDNELQYWVEKELRATVKKHKAEGAWAVVLDPKDSAILAMATHTSKKNHRNKVIHDVYESGSVMKTFSIAGALKHDLVELNTKIKTHNGQFKIGKRIIREADKKHRFKELTVSEILAHSSNVGTAKIALDMTDELLYKTLREFGFGEKSGVDLPGEAKGLLRAPPWRDHLTANISFGHGVAVSALQVANAYAAIANGGVLHKPYLVRKIDDFDNGEVIEKGTEKIRRVLNESTAQQLKMALSSVTVSGGTGVTARIDGFPVAGKTGTAQKVNPNGRGYLKGKYISNFAGFVPANDPQFVIYVVVDSPSAKGYYASIVAAPLFQNIARYALQKKGAVPVYTNARNLIVQKKQKETEKDSQQKVVKIEELKNSSPMKTMPNIKGLTVKEVLRRFRGQDVNLQLKGMGKVVRYSPAVGKPLGKKTKVRVIFR